MSQVDKSEYFRKRKQCKGLDMGVCLECLGTAEWLSRINKGRRIETNGRGINKSLNCVGGEGNGTPLQCSCLENPTDGGAGWAAVPGVAKSQTRLSDITFTFLFPALEKEMATHSSVLVWRIPGTGEPGGLPSMGSHRPHSRHDWCDLAAAAAKLCKTLFDLCLEQSGAMEVVEDENRLTWSD